MATRSAELETTVADDELPPINVRMGNNNEVGHIGHIVFQAPPPDPNSIWHNGVVIGSIAPGAHLLDETTYLFPKLFTDRQLAIGSDIEIQNVRLRLKSMDAVTSSSMGGRPPQVTLWRAACEVIA